MKAIVGILAILSVYLGLAYCTSLGVYDQNVAPASPNSYNIDFMKELCRYVGVSYVRNPQDPLCKYIWCWNGYPYSMDCAPGRMVHPYFYWSEKDPCTEQDFGERCLLGVLKRVHSEDIYEEEPANEEAKEAPEPVLNNSQLKNTMVVEEVVDSKPDAASKTENTQPDPEERVYRDVDQNYNYMHHAK